MIQNSATFNTIAVDFKDVAIVLNLSVTNSNKSNVSIAAVALTTSPDPLQYLLLSPLT